MGRATLQSLHQGEPLAHWIRQRAEEAFAREHVAFQTLRVELAQAHMVCVHHEAHSRDMQAKASKLLAECDAARRKCEAAEMDARFSEKRARLRYRQQQDLQKPTMVSEKTSRHFVRPLR